MPGLDGTGPQGKGPMTGGGRGQCRRDAATCQPEQRERRSARATDDLRGVGRGGRPRGGGRGFCHGGKGKQRDRA